MNTVLAEYVPTPGESPAAEPSKGFTIWRPSDFLAWEEPPETHLLLPALLSRGMMTGLVGQGGIGKSRLVLDLAISQIVGRPWCGLQTAGRPSRWLMVGNENSLFRVRTDLLKMYACLPTDQRELVDEHLRIQALVELDDGIVDLSSQVVCDRLRITIEQAKPDVITLDPLGNIVPGDISKGADLRAGLLQIQRIIQEAGFNPAILPVHHARTGRNNIAQGVGYDAANFALGSKVFYNACRSVIHLMPGSPDDNNLLVLACGKCSNAERFKPRGVRFDPKTFRYEVNPDFDLEEWLRDVSGKGNELACTVAEVVEAVRAQNRKTRDIIAYVNSSTGAGKRSIEDRLTEAVENGFLERSAKGLYNLGPKFNPMPTSTK